MAPELLRRIHEEQIAHESQWLNLLHYNRGVLRAHKSRADSAAFFLASDGLYQPESELIEALRSLNTTVDILEPDRHPICRFPARFKWLRKRLQLADSFFPQVRCPAYDDYFRKIRAKAISLVFVSANINEPASMFGHTFLRFHRQSLTDDEERDHTVSFVARVDSSNAFSYFYKGVVAGFQGRLDYVLMRQRIISYNIAENRNMWELMLDFSQDEVDRVVDHTWEFRNANFDYFFLDENCAFYNLAILEAAKPELDAYRKFLYTVVPSDTVRGILKNEKVLLRARFFPANLMEYKENHQRLNSEERDAVAKLAASAKSELPDGENLNIALILSTAINRVLLRTDKVTEKLSAEDEQILHHLEKLRISNGYAQVSYANADYTNPSIGHFTTMVMSNFGQSRNGSFLDLTFRPAFHELADSPLGYYPFSEIQAFTAEVRYNTEKQQLDMERTELVKIISLKPLHAGHYTGSWLLQLGSRAVRELEAKDFSAPHTFLGRGAYGLAYQPKFIPGNFLLYSLAQGTVEGSAGYEKGYRISPGIVGGIIWNITDRFTSVLSGFYDYILLGDLGFNAGVQGTLNFLPLDFLAFEIKGTYHIQTDYYEARFGLKSYF